LVRSRLGRNLAEFRTFVNSRACYLAGGVYVLACDKAPIAGTLATLPFGRVDEHAGFGIAGVFGPIDAH
jgi:hypothetical protein